MEADEHGVRAPIQQQHDQLIGGVDDNPFGGLFAGMRPNRPQARSFNEGQNAPNRNDLADPFLRRAATQRIPRMREPRPQDFKFSLDMVYADDPEEAEEQRLVRQQAQRYTLRDYIGYFISSIWYTIKWTITLGGTLANTGYEQ